ncbi:MAG: hypothetical protein AAGG68_28620 [Bacteroidota bacterium]
MKTVFSTIFITFTSLLFAQSAEEAAIKALCLKDTEAYMQRDFETWKTAWYHDESASMLITDMGRHAQGWDAIRDSMKEYYEENSMPSKSKLSHDNYIFNIQGDQAFVAFEQTMILPLTVNGGKKWQDKTYEVRSLIKVNGEWKIYNQVTSPMVHEKDVNNTLFHLVSASMMMAQLGNVEGATKTAAFVAELYPNLPNGHWGQGWYAIQRKDKAAAMKHLEKAMSLFDGEAPEDLKALFEQAKALK